MSNPHPYLPNSVSEIKEQMLEEIGVRDISELYSDIPEELRFQGELDIPGPYAEAEVRAFVKGILEKNLRLKCYPFMGGGVWPHYVPAVVDEVVHRTEFLTSYTPYQPEISQGILQGIFEYQSLISELVGLDVTNSSLYDWASALGEAARMANRINRRNTIVVPHIISPGRLSVLRTYTESVGLKIIEVDYEQITGELDLEDLKDKVDDNTAAVYIENPSYLGFVEESVEAIEEIAHDNESLYIVGVDPISLGILKAPGDYGADIVVGEGQPLGNHMNYGGPLLGILSCRHESKMIRQMPGRIIGITNTEMGGRRGFTMTLQTREQHIRREKATSNICTNQALNALAAAVYLSLLGNQGIRDLSEKVMSRARYAQRRIGELPGVRAPLFNNFHFKEFTVGYKNKTVDEIDKALIASGIQGGISLKRDFPELGEASLYCVTEVHSKKDIDSLVSIMREGLEA